MPPNDELERPTAEAGQATRAHNLSALASHPVYASRPLQALARRRINSSLFIFCATTGSMGLYADRVVRRRGRFFDAEFIGFN